MTTRPTDTPTAAIPPGVVCAADYAALARERLDPAAWAYISGGAGDEITLRANRQAFDSQRISSRLLRAVGGGHTRQTLLGQALAHPIVLAPIAHQRLVHPDGELATVQAAAALDAAMVVSTLSSVSLEEVAAMSRQSRQTSPLWFQLYVQHDRGFTRALVKRAEAAGYRALVITADAPINGPRNREHRAGFTLPPHVAPANLSAMPPSALPQPRPDQSAVFDIHMDHAPTWSDIEQVCAATALPVIVKGVVHPDDAAQALACGAQGVIVSNHGGRVLDTLPAALDILPRVAERLGGSAPVLMDGGIQRGTDVFKALALGASAVLVGRAWLYALASTGPLGVAHVLRLLRDELEITMALTGCRTLADITPDRLWN